ncbi:MAG: DUF222 domain-containing protein [Actinomycetota bacterium]
MFDSSKSPKGPPKQAEVKAVLAAVLDLVGRARPDETELGFVMELVEDFTKMENACAAGKALYAKRVADSGAWRVQGHKTPADWMAVKTGSSVGSAMGALKTAEKLAELPKTEQAVRSGELSQAQALEIASAASAHPASEAELLEAAKTEGVAVLKERCLRVRASATDEKRRHEALHRNRSLRYWTGHGGGVHLEGRFTPENGALVWAALKPFKQKLDAEARRGGRIESKQALYADALVEVAKHVRQCSQIPRRLGPSSLVHVRIDHEALLRGHTEPGETCEIPGFGPIPVTTAKELANDAFLAAILTEGADIKAVGHMGRNIPSRINTALLERDDVCVVPGCTEREGLQIDHTVPYGQNGPTKLANLSRLCRVHHAMKTHHGYVLKGGPGAWIWEPPKACQSNRPPPRE